jgi:DNA topoisomerase IA
MFYEQCMLPLTGDHPPITPVALALPHELQSSDTRRIYDLVVRHFLATISPDALFQVTKAKFSAPLCKESFTLHGKKELQAGFLAVYRDCVDSSQVCVVDDEGGSGSGTNIDTNSGSNSSSKNYNIADYCEDTMQYKGIVELPELEVGVGYRVVSVKMRQGATKPPGAFHCVLFAHELAVANVNAWSLIPFSCIYFMDRYLLTALN